MLTIYSFYWNCGRMGELSGIFVATTDDVEKAIGKEVCFGEVLGKYSDIYGPLQAKDLTVVSQDQDFIKKFETIFGADYFTGYNPLHYLEEE